MIVPPVADARKSRLVTLRDARYNLDKALLAIESAQRELDHLNVVSTVMPAVDLAFDATEFSSSLITQLVMDEEAKERNT